MNERIGLKIWEMREIVRTIGATVISMSLAVFLAGLVVGPHWILAAYAAGGVLAWAALRADRANRDRGASGSPVRRTLGWICEGKFRAIAILMTGYAGLWVFWAFLSMPGSLALLEGLPEGEMTKDQVIAGMREAIQDICRQFREHVAFPMQRVGIGGIAVAFLSGLGDWLVLGSIGARRGVKPWRLLGFGRSRRDVGEFVARERARRRRLLRGEA